MSSVGFHTKHYLKHVSIKVLGRYSTGRRVIRVLITGTDPPVDSAEHDTEIDRVTGRLSAAVENSAGMMADLEERILNASARTEFAVKEAGKALDQISELKLHLEATPYMSDPGRFLSLDSEGHERLGYDSIPVVGDDEFYAGFEDLFRGSESFVEERQRYYLDLIRGNEPVVDLGSGRGEMLSLLKKEGIQAVGIEIDHGMVKRSHGKHLEVEQGDLIDYLRNQPDGSIGTVFASQVIEHLPFDALMTVLQIAHEKLRPGGQLIAETVNPHSIRALKMFWIDLSHEKPIFPEVLLALCQHHCFSEAQIVFPNGSADLGANLRNEGEYAVIARKGT